jgi:aspartyl protease family protein
MLVDTGATRVSLSRKDAETLGLKVEPKDYVHRVSTANGVTTAAPVRLDEVEIGGVGLRNVDALVTQAGASEVSLLGMSFLGWPAGFEVAKGNLVLRQ